MRSKPFELAATFVFGFALIANSVACGGSDSSQNDTGSPPQVTDPQVTCQASEDEAIEGRPVVRQVSVRIQDPDRDLKLEEGASVPGQFAGNRVRFSDSDGDGKFVWKVSSELDRIICEGQFNIGVQARDRKGHTTDFQAEVIKNDESESSN